MPAIYETDFRLPNQQGPRYQGKVGDVYTINHEEGPLLAVVRTDRLSAYDVVMPQAIPHKGQVLNQMSAELLERTAASVPNWFITSPDPNVTIGFKAEPIKIEMIVRGSLLGSAWRAYNTEGRREFGGVELKDGLVEFETFDAPLVTPTTKAETGHDEDITPREIITEGLATREEYQQMAAHALTLFELGQLYAESEGLYLADTKFEFGRRPDGSLVVIDEVLTADSSRYFPLREYEAYSEGNTDQRPEQLSKEFVREWLRAHGFTGQAGEMPPEMPLDFIAEVSVRYQELYERLIGKPFRPYQFHDAGQRAGDMKSRIIAAVEHIDDDINAKGV